ncbi:MAG: hypothetical protein IPM57_03525 [Oligoflexia bacterium]|nr:hypothetical protein [Oligoflexia bacterium]
MKTLFLALSFAFFVTTFAMAAEPLKHYQVFRTDNEHCFAIDAKRTIYRIDDVGFKCSEMAQPNPDGLTVIEKQNNLGEVLIGNNSAKMSNMVMGDLVDLGGLKNSMYLYRTARGQKNNQPVFENFFVNTKEIGGGRFELSVSVVRFEYADDNSPRTSRLGRNYLNFRFEKLSSLPRVVIDLPAPIESIAPREINIPALAEMPAISVNTDLPVSSVPVFKEETKPEVHTPASPPTRVTPETQEPGSPAVATPYTQPQVIFIHEKEQMLCSNIVKRYGRKLADQDCSQVKDEKITQRCFLQNHCNFEKGCNSEKCVSQYIQMGQFDDVEKLMQNYKKALSQLAKANKVLSAAEAKLKDCDTLDKNGDERKKRAEAVEQARKQKNAAQKSHYAAREKLDKLVQAKINNSNDKFSCMKHGESTFRFFYDSWIYILDYKERYWTCVMGQKHN